MARGFGTTLGVGTTECLADHLLLYMPLDDSPVMDRVLASQPTVTGTALIADPATLRHQYELLAGARMSLANP